MKGITIGQMKIGDQGSFEKTVTETDVYLYAGITGDLNPAHVNARAMADSMFGGRIAHGMLSGGFISCVFGMHFPGPGTIYLNQELKFLAPVKIGDTVKAVVEVIEMNVEKNRIVCRTWVENQDGKVVVDGKATVMPPR